MKTAVRSALIAIVLALPTVFVLPSVFGSRQLANPASIDCPFDSFKANRVGTKVINGKFYDVYRCLNGHEQLLEQK